MKNYGKVFAPFLLAILLGSLTFIFAQSKDNGGFDGKRPPRGEGFGPPHGGGGFGPPHGGGGLPPFILDKLNLTAEQKDQIEAFQANSLDAGKEFFEKVRTSDEQLRTMVEAGSFNEENARQILNSKAAAMTELELLRLRTDAAIFDILTTEQKAQLAQFKNQRPPMPPPDGFRPDKK